MKAIFFYQYGGSEVLQYGDRPRPKVKANQLLVETHAASINPRDWLLREGRYIFRFLMPAFPLIPGSDISGKVIELGKAVTQFKIGDEVFGMQTPLGGMGGYAEYIAIDERAVTLKPARISHIEAAAVPCAALTSYYALRKIGKVKKGSKVVIIGASGGVGSYGVQLAKALGATVVGVCSAANIDLVRSLGADEVIDYKQQHYSASLRNQDLVYDTIGRESLAKASPALKKNGRYITTIPGVTTFLASIFSQLWRLICLDNAKSSHVVLVPADGKMLAEIAQLMTSGKVRSIIDSVYPLKETKQAHDKSRTFRTKGKLVLNVRDEMA